MLPKIFFQDAPPVTLLEAKQDEQFETLEDAVNQGADGIMSTGLSVCYTVIFKNDERVAAAHISSFPKDLLVESLEDKDKNEDRVDLMLIDMLDYVGSSCEIILARSFSGYKMQQEDDEIRGETRESAEEYFREQDRIYTAFFANNYRTHGLTINFVNMPHDFLMIGLDGNIRYFEEYPGDEINCERLDYDVADDDDNITRFSP